ncbi:MAG: TRAP transporter small permease subunit [Burkholderiales bacterium]|nr:TRAP transporter small permease subunit [Burkholderiales bacterium]
MVRFAFVTAPGVLLGALMLAGIAINFANVVGRYAFGHALFWAEETMVFITIWGVFIGMAAAAYDGNHLNMDLFFARLRGRWRTLLGVLVAATTLACCVFVVVQSYQVVALFVQANQVSVSAGIPKAIPHAALLAGFLLTGLAVVVRLRSYVTGKF